MGLGERLDELKLGSTGKALLVLDFIFVTALLVSSSGADVPGSESNVSVENASDITFITTQGGSEEIYPHGGEIRAVHTPTKETLWRNDDYRRYMDVDALDNDTILTVAGDTSGEELERIAVAYNWREDKELYRFEVPRDVHDIDYLGNNSFAIADKANSRVYVYNNVTDTVTWKYDFIENFPRSAGGDSLGHEFTHLNDIDPEMNQSAFLVSPRNFDRVFLINRSNKEVIFELGEEDNYDILYEQHNPDMLSHDPYTVIVSDSENNRLVEYQHQNESWEEIWSYSGDLNWPRDGDRLPSGNTLITDSGGNRVLEVTPQGEVVWEYEISIGPYDSERLGTGDGSTHLPTPESVNHLARAEGFVGEKFNRLYSLIGLWIMPQGTGEFEFSLLLLLVSINTFYVLFYAHSLFGNSFARFN